MTDMTHAERLHITRLLAAGHGLEDIMELFEQRTFWVVFRPEEHIGALIEGAYWTRLEAERDMPGFAGRDYVHERDDTLVLRAVRFGDLQRGLLSPEWYDIAPLCQADEDSIYAQLQDSSVDELQHYYMETVALNDLARDIFSSSQYKLRAWDVQLPTDDIVVMTGLAALLDRLDANPKGEEALIEIHRQVYGLLDHLAEMERYLSEDD